jgi:hypothetical protein
MYMQQRCGAWQVGTNASQGAVAFKLFVPDRNSAAQVDLGSPGATARPLTNGDPRIASIQVGGSFQNSLGQTDWDWSTAPALTAAATTEGTFWTYTTPVDLPSGFYEYKYFVTFNDGSTRVVGDPCARYGGSENQNSAFVIGGSPPGSNVVRPLGGPRLPLRDLVVYELMIDDFTDEYRSFRADRRSA